MDTSKYKDLFISEAEEQIATLSRLLLEIEKAPGTKEQYAVCMRSAHTIKGAGATMGYKNAAELAHAIEDVFHSGERGAIDINSSVITTLLAALDGLSAALTAIKERDEDLPQDELITRLRAILSTPTANGGAATPSENTATESTPKPTPQAQIAVPDAVKVPVERLDALMGLFEEMLMLRLKLESLIEPAREMLRTIDNPLMKQRLFFVNEFKTLFTDMARLLSETQDELLSIRLVPLEQLFNQFPRMMRDAGVQSGKKVNFVVTGGDVELDRSVVGGLGGALAHILRNAVSHGIEKEGTVTLSAEREKDRVRISVEDDGTGVLYDRVRAVAIERGVITSEEASRLGKTELNELLFLPQMSTDAKVSMLSGRGVGLYAVRSFAQDVGGSIGIVSPANKEGRGTRFVLDLPISLATARVLLVQSRRFIFALPFRHIERTFSFRAKDVQRSAHQKEVVLDGMPIPLISLEEIFGVIIRKEAEVDPEKELIAVLLSDERGKVGLMVEKIIGERELLVKALPPVLRDLESFSGSALLPDGRTVLLLDAAGLLTHTLNGILEGIASKKSAN